MLLLAVAFLFGSGTSQLTLLVVVLKQHNMAAPVIASILSLMTVTIMLGALVSGTLASRFGAVRTLLLGGIIALAAIAAMPLALDSAVLMAVASFGRGFGFGLLTPSGQMFAQAQAHESDRARAVGLFTAMFLIPTFFGPAVAQFLLAGCDVGFFVGAVIPIALAIGVVGCLLGHNTETPAAPDTAGYLSLARDRRLWLPNLATAQSGLCYAFATYFLTLMLVGYGTPVAMFFTPFAVVLLTTRFVGLAYLQRLPPAGLAALGLLSYTAGLIAMALSPSSAVAVAAAGCLFGFGYGVTLVCCIEWSTRLYPAPNKRPIALINTSFNVGSIVAQQITGAALVLIGWSGVLIVLSAIVFTVLMAVARHATGPQRSGRDDQSQLRTPVSGS